MSEGQAPPASQQSEPTLAADTYSVYVRIPEVWWDEKTTVAEIADRLHLTRMSVQRRVDALLKLHLVERRKVETISPTTDIRRIGK